jgi:hypothetical protein
MKNIHVIKTDKPSRLFIWIGALLKISIEATNQGTNQHIYITSDEEITGFEHNIWVIKGERIFLWQNTMALVSDNKPRKIILTTDHQLIQDGVQAIDDEFLEWFCKNSSCEWVEVDDRLLEKCYTYYRKNILKNKNLYKIILPKEEPKQECKDCNVSLEDCTCIEDTIDMKQKTLEELKDLAYYKANAEEDYLAVPISVMRYISQLEQQENSYSEEEVLELLQKFNQNAMEYIKEDEKSIMTSITLKKWFEQFKKK